MKSEHVISGREKELDRILHNTEEFYGDDWTYLRGVLAGYRDSLSMLNRKPLTSVRRGTHRGYINKHRNPASK